MPVDRKTLMLGIYGAIGLFVLWVLTSSYKVIPPGHVGVASFFGKVKENAFKEGLHFPVNPLYDWSVEDARQKTYKETAAVPSQDQLRTEIDVSVQYRFIAEMAPEMKKETGSFLRAFEVHVKPKLRSVLREQGKTVKRAEDFFNETTQERLQTNLQTQLAEFCTPKGIEIQAVLIRDIRLPKFILAAIEQKKQREQEVEKQKAELERFKTEQEQKVAQAEAERNAAAAEAEKVRILADAEAYKIKEINKAMASNPNYIKLIAMEALKEISKDPNAKIYFLNGDSPQPLPLMKLGDK